MKEKFIVFLIILGILLGIVWGMGLKRTVGEGRSAIQAIGKTFLHPLLDFIVPDPDQFVDPEGAKKGERS